MRYFHGHANDYVVEINADVDASRLFVSPHDSAVALRGGYRGPGRVIVTG